MHPKTHWWERPILNRRNKKEGRGDGSQRSQNPARQIPCTLMLQNNPLWLNVLPSRSAGVATSSLQLWAEACDSGTGRWNPNVVTRGEPVIQLTTDTVSKIASHWHAFSLSLSLPLPLSPFVKREVPLLGWPSPGLLIRNPQSQAHWRVGRGLLNIYQMSQVRSTREMIKTNAASMCIWIPGRFY